MMRLLLAVFLIGSVLGYDSYNNYCSCEHGLNPRTKRVWEFKISEGQKPNRPPRSYIGLIIDVLDSVPGNRRPYRNKARINIKDGCRHKFTKLHRGRTYRATVYQKVINHVYHFIIDSCQEPKCVYCKERY